MQPLGLSPTGPLPRFNGLLYVADKPKKGRQPKVRAVIQDFSATALLDKKREAFPQHDGTILFQSPSGQLHLLEENNPAVAELTDACRKAGSFQTRELPKGNRNLIRAVWRDIKALFVSGMFPITVQEDERGERLYETLLETEFKRTYEPLEHLLTTPLGYDYAAAVPTVHSFNGKKPSISPSGTP